MITSVKMTPVSKRQPNGETNVKRKRDPNGNQTGTKCRKPIRTKRQANANKTASKRAVEPNDEPNDEPNGIQEYEKRYKYIIN